LSIHRHNHSHEEASWGKRLVVSMVMNLIIPAVQIYGGIISGSMALISDALHNLSDFISLVINYGALAIGRRGPTHQQTFGYKRAEIFATLVSVGLLYGTGYDNTLRKPTTLPTKLGEASGMVLAELDFLQP
jgi:cobalt-zinc-cadmium efflux system protein